MNKNDIEKFARQTLKEHGLYKTPVDPVELANKLGVKVCNAVFAEENISGMVAKRDHNLSILVNQNDSPFRKRFSIAHELGHHFLHLQDDGEFVDTQADLFRVIEPNDASFEIHIKEVQANQFAAALLMDAELVKKLWDETHSIEIMASTFKVSEEAMGYRIDSLRLK